MTIGPQRGDEPPPSDWLPISSIFISLTPKIHLKTCCQGEVHPGGYSTAHCKHRKCFKTATVTLQSHNITTIHVWEPHKIHLQTLLVALWPHSFTSLLFIRPNCSGPLQFFPHICWQRKVFFFCKSIELSQCWPYLDFYKTLKFVQFGPVQIFSFACKMFTFISSC